jgi:hypothetical protein
MAITGEKDRAGYLASRVVARLATIDHTGQPDAAAVACEPDGDTIVIGSDYDLDEARRYRQGVALSEVAGSRSLPNTFE